MRRRALLLLVPALLAAAPMSAAEISSYALRLELAADGAGTASGVVHLAAAGPGGFDLPLGFGAPRALRLTAGPAGTTLAAVPQNGQSILHLVLPADTPPEFELRFELTVSDLLETPAARTGEPQGASPGDRRVFRHSLLSSQPTGVGGYRFEVVFPEGMRAHAIREALPKPRKGEAGPRALLQAIDGREGARLEVAGLAQGETASLQIELVRRSRSPAWWVVGIALSVLYLVKFKDLVARPT